MTSQRTVMLRPIRIAKPVWTSVTRIRAMESAVSSDWSMSAGEFLEITSPARRCVRTAKGVTSRCTGQGPATSAQSVHQNQTKQQEKRDEQTKIQGRR